MSFFNFTTDPRTNLIKQRNYEIQDGITNTISSFLSAFKANKYASDVAQAQAQSAANARSLQQSKAQSLRVMADYQSNQYTLNAQSAFQDAINLNNQAISNRSIGLSQVAQAKGQAKQAFAVSGVKTTTGSARDVINNIQSEGFRLVDADFNQSMSRVNNLLTQQSEFNNASAMVRYSAEEQIRFDQAEVSQL